MAHKHMSESIFSKSLFGSSNKDSWVMYKAADALTYYNNIVNQYKDHPDIVLTVKNRQRALETLMRREDIYNIQQFLDTDTYLNAWRARQEDDAKPVISVDSDKPVISVDSDKPVISVDSDKPVITDSVNTTVAVTGSRNGVDFRRTFKNRGQANAWVSKMGNIVAIDNVFNEEIDVNTIVQPDIDSTPEQDTKFIATYLIKVPEDTSVGIGKLDAKYFIFNWSVPVYAGAEAVATPTALGTAINNDPVVAQLASDGFTGHPTIVAGWKTNLDTEYNEAYNKLNSTNNWTRQHKASLKDQVKSLGAAIDILAREHVIGS